MISNLDFCGIVIAINKEKFLKQHTSSWSITKFAWSLILEQYDMELRERTVDHGNLSVDKSPNKIQCETTKIISELIEWGTRYQRIDRVNPPKFVDSCVCGIQVADALAYGTLQNLTNNKLFTKYWASVSNKLRSKNNVIHGHGYKIYPD